MAEKAASSLEPHKKWQFWGFRCKLWQFWVSIQCVVIHIQTCTRDFVVHGQPEAVLAFAGGDAVLPCSFKVAAGGDFPTVEWSKEGLKPNVIFLYRDGCETHEMKNPAFEYRTSLIAKELKNGNVSLRISDVRLSDAGKYQCMRLWKDAPWEVTITQLVFTAGFTSSISVSEPKLSVVSAESGGVTLQCEAGCWLPQPEIKFLDHEGKEIPAEEPKRERHESGCDTTRQRVTVQSFTVNNQQFLGKSISLNVSFSTKTVKNQTHKPLKSVSHIYETTSYRLKSLVYRISSQ
uniref:Ig-like domain-containing protein n=1 Tax=Stegastes partitus TaxID=144197 RepID=A0A3B5AUI9_9TELE